MPHAVPSSASESGSGIGHLDTENKAKKSQDKTDNHTQISPCIEQLPCFVVEEPQAKSKEEQAKTDSLDALTRREMWATIFGVIGALIGVAVLIWQTILVRASAKAALLNAKAVINNERPWIMLEKIEPAKDYWGIAQRETDAGKPVYALPVFKNYGNTPGWIVQSTAYIIMSNRAQGSILTYGQPPIYPNPMPLPDKEQDYRFIVRMDGERVLSPQDIRDIESGLAYLILYGFVKYKDPFFEQTKEYRTTKFCYALRLIHRKDEIFSFWEPFGAFGANDHT